MSNDELDKLKLKLNNDGADNQKNPEEKEWHFDVVLSMMKCHF